MIRKAVPVAFCLALVACQHDDISQMTNEEKWETVPECPPVHMKGFDQGATDADFKALMRAEKVCHDKYDACLKIFIKVKFQTYRAICG